MKSKYSRLLITFFALSLIITLIFLFSGNKGISLDYIKTPDSISIFRGDLISAQANDQSALIKKISDKKVIGEIFTELKRSKGIDITDDKTADFNYDYLVRLHFNNVASSEESYSKGYIDEIQFFKEGFFLVTKLNKDTKSFQFLKCKLNPGSKLLKAISN